MSSIVMLAMALPSLLRQQGCPCSRVHFNQFLEDLSTVDSCTSFYQRAVLKEQQRRRRPHIKTLREFRVVVDLHGANAHALRNFGRDLGEYAGQLLAGNAAFGPEVDDRQAGLPQNLGIEVPLIPNGKIALGHGATYSCRASMLGIALHIRRRLNNLAPAPGVCEATTVASAVVVSGILD